MRKFETRIDEVLEEQYHTPANMAKLGDPCGGSCYGCTRDAQLTHFMIDPSTIDRVYYYCESCAKIYKQETPCPKK